MKVAHLIDSAGLYGAEQVLLMLCQEQQKQGIYPLIVSCGLPGESDKAIEVEAAKQGIEVIAWRMPAGLKIKETKTLVSHLKTQGVDILHSHGYKFNILLGAIGKKNIGLPLVSTVHGYVKARFPKKMWVYEVLDRIFLKRFDAIVLVSEKMREIAAFRNNPKTCVIKNGISSRRPLVASTLEAKPYQLLAVGRLSPEKGFDVLIRALAELNKNHVVCQLTIVGDGRLRGDLIRLIEQLQQTNTIRLAGFVAQAEQLFHQYQLIVMPSLTEGIPVTLLEAMRNKTPVLASAVGGIPDVLGPLSECLMQPGDVQSVVNTIRTWMNKPVEVKQSIVGRHYQRFVDAFSAEKMAEDYRSLYGQLRALK